MCVHCEFATHLQETSIPGEKSTPIKLLCGQIYWVHDSSGVERIKLMFKLSENLYYQELLRQDWTFAYDRSTLIQVQQRGDKWPRLPLSRELTDAKVELSQSF